MTTSCTLDMCFSPTCTGAHRRDGKTSKGSGCSRAKWPNVPSTFSLKLESIWTLPSEGMTSMTPRKITTSILLVLVAASLIVFVARQTGVIPAELATFGAAADPPRHKIVAYYFHGQVRCETCLNIEHYTNEALNTHFGGDLADGRLEWRVINRELPPNEHFVQDYGLYSQALIIIDSIPGQPAVWKNLEAIWDHAHDKPAFMEYVRSEVDQYLKRL